MNCYYCFSELSKIESHIIIVYTCGNCSRLDINVYYLQNASSLELTEIHFGKPLKPIWIRVTSNRFKIIDSSKYDNATILELDIVPELTPLKMKHKIDTAKVFS